MKKSYFNSVFKILLPGVLGVMGNSVYAQNIFALTSNNELTSFLASNPQQAKPAIPITGITSGQTLVGIDSRPNTGELYALGYNSTDSTSNLYTINKITAIATKIGSTTIKLGLGNGSKVGFDFNPTVDRIRVVSGTDNSYRLHPVTGAIAFKDGNLKFAQADANFGKNPNAGASAYTNSFIGAGTTTLFNYDDSLNIITSQIPPNEGTLNTIGSTNITITPGSTVMSGFDIYKDPSTLGNAAYLSISGIGSASNLYTVNTTTGGAAIVGQIGLTGMIKDIAVEIDRTLPSPRTGKLIFGLQGLANLISFDSENPKVILNLVTITGLTA
ncbi:MAG: DUF4394 domain-containing protein [Opitutaceae bacterium]|nr:DUF4394 domain-containing protein [Cytophagales bacterium]